METDTVAAVVHVANLPCVVCKKCMNFMHDGADTYCKLRVEMPRETPEVNLVKKT